jgi:hypothetical protein
MLPSLGLGLGSLGSGVAMLTDLQKRRILKDSPADWAETAADIRRMLRDESTFWGPQDCARMGEELVYLDGLIEGLPLASLPPMGVDSSCIRSSGS